MGLVFVPSLYLHTIMLTFVYIWFAYISFHADLSYNFRYILHYNSESLVLSKFTLQQKVGLNRVVYTFISAELCILLKTNEVNIKNFLIERDPGFDKSCPFK